MRKLYGIAALVFTGFIFYNSSLPAPASDETSYFFVNLVSGINAFLDKPVPLEEMNHYIRKTAHFTEFAALGMSLILLLREYRLPQAAKWAWAIGTFYAGTDELHQYFNGTRTPSLRDVAIDSAGVVFGVMVMILLWYLIRQIKSKTAQ